MQKRFFKYLHLPQGTFFIIDFKCKTIFQKKIYRNFQIWNYNIQVSQTYMKRLTDHPHHKINTYFMVALNTYEKGPKYLSFWNDCLHCTSRPRNSYLWFHCIPSLNEIFLKEPKSPQLSETRCSVINWGHLDFKDSILEVFLYLEESAGKEALCTCTFFSRAAEGTPAPREIALSASQLAFPSWPCCLKTWNPA